MENSDISNLIDRFRTDIHAMADRICDLVELKINLDYEKFTADTGRENANDNEISRPDLEEKRDVFTLQELKDMLHLVRQNPIKPSEVTFPNGKEIEVCTWKQLVEVMLQECVDIPKCKEKMMQAAAAELTGQKRLLGCDPSMFYKPVKISEELYFNGTLSAQLALKRLVRVMDMIGFDHSQINVNTRSANQQKKLPARFADRVPLDRVCAYAKGRKPSTLTLPNGEVMRAGTWTEVIRKLFDDCCKDPERLKKLRDITGRYSSPTGTIILDSAPDQMTRPIEISDKVYLNGSGPTEISMQRAVQILSALGYHCSDVTLKIQETHTGPVSSEQQISERPEEQEEDTGPEMSM